MKEQACITISIGFLRGSFVKANFISALLDCPKDCSQTKCVKVLSARQPMRYCCKFWGMLVAPEAVGEDAPDSFYKKDTGKKKMFHRLILWAEITFRVTHPFPLDHVIFSQDSIFLQQPHKDINLVWDLWFPNMFKDGPATVLVKCSYTDFVVKWLIFYHFQLTTSSILSNL